MPALFDEIVIGEVVPLGAARVDPTALAQFIEAFSPGWTIDRGAPDPMTFALWVKLDMEASVFWPQTKRLGIDALRWLRNPPAGELLRGRRTHAVSEEHRRQTRPGHLRKRDELPDIRYEGVPAAFAEVAQALGAGRASVAPMVKRPGFVAGRVQRAGETAVPQ